MLTRGLDLEKAETVGRGFKHTKLRMYVMRVRGLMETSLHPSLITVCCIVLCCTNVVPPSDGSAHGEEDIHCLSCASANLCISTPIMTDFGLLTNQL